MDSLQMNMGACLRIRGRKQTLIFFFQGTEACKRLNKNIRLCHTKMAMTSFLPSSEEKKWLALYNKHSRVHSVQKPHMQT